MTFQRSSFLLTKFNEYWSIALDEKAQQTDRVTGVYNILDFTHSFNLRESRFYQSIIFLFLQNSTFFWMKVLFSTPENMFSKFHD